MSTKLRGKNIPTKSCVLNNIKINRMKIELVSINEN